MELPQSTIETATDLGCGEGVSELIQGDQYQEGMKSFNLAQLIFV